ncbi:hypothetical protein [Spirosoma arboris]|nr:hypothetical protein [Spirosoma arboris]
MTTLKRLITKRQKDRIRGLVWSVLRKPFAPTPVTYENNRTNSHG